MLGSAKPAGNPRCVGKVRGSLGSAAAFWRVEKEIEELELDDCSDRLAASDEGGNCDVIRRSSAAVSEGGKSDDEFGKGSPSADSARGG